MANVRRKVGQKGIAFDKLIIPKGGDVIYKDECVFSFDCPEREGGLYVCMQRFIGLGKPHVLPYFQATGNPLFLHIKRNRKIVKANDDEEPPEKQAATKLAIGVPGGFDTGEKKFEYEEHYAIISLPDWTVIDLPDSTLPETVQECVTKIIEAPSAFKLSEMNAMAGTWDGEVKAVSKYSENLEQLDNGVKIPPTGWKCSRCDMTNNLWANLTDGSIHCGRRFWDGSGGNNHAVDHYNETHFPLAVKLGTITPDGADVYSYAEDDMVLDPHLDKHLKHFGINITNMTKTEKSMVELEIELNQRQWEFDRIQEAGKELTAISGPGYTGIHNLGNSCYINSVMQVLASIPDVRAKYFLKDKFIQYFSATEGIFDFNMQMSKFINGLLSGDYSSTTPTASKLASPLGGDTEEIGDKTPAAVAEPRREGVRPEMFKNLIGKGHKEFATKQQQDAQEFLLYLIDLIDRNCRQTFNPTDAFAFEVEDRLFCDQSQSVKYMKRSESILALTVPMEAASNISAVKEYERKKQSGEQIRSSASSSPPSSDSPVRAKVTFEACLQSFAAQEVIPDFYNSNLKSKGTAHRTSRLLSFPDYLIIQISRFTISEDWTPKKLDVSIEVPMEVDLEFLRSAGGLQAGEAELIDPGEGKQSNPAEEEIKVNEEFLAQLVEMGFPLNACKKALYNTSNSGVEHAYNYVIQHMEDPDFDAPLVLTSVAAKDPNISEDSITMLAAMGFTRSQAILGLTNTNNNLEQAADWLFNHPQSVDLPPSYSTTEAAAGAGGAGGGSDSAAVSGAGATTGAETSTKPKCRDGNGKYSLTAFISHMGSSTSCGHYVSHIYKNGQWIIYNDEKVAVSKNPPFDLGYLYFFKRKDLE